MKLLILLLSALSALAQMPEEMLLADKAVVSGGAPASGAPVFFNAGTNSVGSANTLSVTNANAGTGTLRLHILHVSWYNSGSVTLNSVVNNLSEGGTILTNAYWMGGGKDVIYYWSDSAMTYATVTFSDTAEIVLQLIQLTNCATSSIFGTSATNYTASISTAISNSVSSSSSGLVLGFSTASFDTTHTATFGYSGTKVSEKGTSGTHGGAAAWTAGAAAVVSGVSWSSGVGSGSLITVPVKGP